MVQTLPYTFQDWQSSKDCQSRSPVGSPRQTTGFRHMLICGGPIIQLCHQRDLVAYRGYALVMPCVSFSIT